MKVVVVGLGVQGLKRRRVAGADYVASIDPSTSMRSIAASRMFRSRITTRPLLHSDGPKQEILSYCLRHGKHVLVEKPLWTKSIEAISELEKLARSKGASAIPPIITVSSRISCACGNW